ncbi:putative toxin-antitoxin system toxin component, PIN family [Candidatus Woesearchaeota archaeon]|nr:putative toxin-antitoxin system toxin component, PIN family [Candidatus Woesearchaeota archaeon]
MIRITVDTNVLVSATFWYGASYRIIELVEQGKVELVLSEAIIQEFSAVLEYEEIKKKIVNKGLLILRTVEKLVSMSKIVVPAIKITAVKEDPDDDKVLECAVEGGVDYLISKDNHLLKFVEYGKIKIVSPEGFLNIF